MIVEEACTRPLWEEHSKELNILFLNLINESERDFSILAIKIHLKKKKSGNEFGLIIISGNFSSLSYFKRKYTFNKIFDSRFLIINI